MLGIVPGIVLGVVALALGAWGFAPRGYPFLKLRGQGRGVSKVIGAVFLLMGVGFLAMSLLSEGFMTRR